MIFGKGISREGCLLDLALKFDLIQKTGAWFSYQGEKIGQGKENAKEYLAQNPQIYEEIEQQINEQIKDSGDLMLDSDDEE